MANEPTIYIVASGQNRNGKTLLARLLADFLMLEGHDPFLIDTDAPEGALRNFFPGRTALADLSQITGEMKLFDTVLGGPGRDYVIDLPAKHTESFFAAEENLQFFKACREKGFRIFLFYIVDNTQSALRGARDVQAYPGIDLFVPVRNMIVGSTWPEDEGAFTLPALPPELARLIGNRRFSLRAFIQGDRQDLPEHLLPQLQDFLFEIMTNLTNLEPMVSLQSLKRG